MKSPCQAVVLRYVHDLSTQEFVNVGVVLVSRDRGFAEAKFVSSWKRVTQMFPEADPVHLRRLAISVQAAVTAYAHRWNHELELEPRLEASPMLSAIIPSQEIGLHQSNPISGITEDPRRTLDEVFSRHVGKFESRAAKETREDNDVWRAFVEQFPSKEAYLDALRPHSVMGRHFNYDFRHAWQNGRWNAAQPLSFDMRDARSIVEKAVGWVGRIKALDVSPEDFKVVFLVGLPPSDRPKSVLKAASDATSILSAHLEDSAQVVKEAESVKLVSKIVEDIDHRRGDILTE